MREMLRARRTGKEERWLLALLLLTPLTALCQPQGDPPNDWLEAEKETDRLDQPRGWRLRELEAARPMIPDAENSAKYITAIAHKPELIAVSNAPYYDRIFKKLTPTAQLNAQQLGLIRGELAKIRKRLEQAHKLKDLPRGRFAIKYSDDFISTPIAEQTQVRSVADWLRHDAFMQAQDRQYDRALESCQAMTNAARALDGELMIITYRIRLATQVSAMHTLERSLAQGEASAERLQRMQELIGMELKTNSWLQAVRGERAGYHHLFDNLRTGKLDAGVLGITPPEKSKNDAKLKQTQLSLLLRDYPELLRHMNQAVEIAKLPSPERRAKIETWEKAMKETKNPIMQLLSPPLARLHDAECGSQAILRCGYLALAAERYRLKHQQWPASLDVLTKGKWVDRIPADPIDGQPLRYRPHKDGIVIYSVGIDQMDDQGKIDHDRPNATGVDIGFRLWDVKMRRQAPLPPVATDDEK